MASCEVCGKDTAPGDVLVAVEGTFIHYFCGEEHREQWKTKPEDKVSEEEASEAGRVLSEHGHQAPEQPAPAPSKAPQRRKRQAKS